MAAAALKPDPQPTSYSIKVEPRFVAVLEQMAREEGCSIEHLIETWVELSCVELGMGRTVTVTDDEMQAVREGIAQLDRGEGIPHEQVMSEMKARYGW